MAAAAAPFVPAVLVLALWVALAPANGGYFARSWYPATLGAIGVLVVVLIAGNRMVPAGRAARVGLGALAAWVGFNYLSLLWAASAGSALESSNKLLLYLVVAWVISIVPWTSRSAGAFLGAWALAIAVVCAWSLLSALDASELSGYLLEWRYEHPVGYSNGTAALAVLAFWPALMLASRSDLPAPGQALFLAAAVFLLEFSLLPQSRGSVVGLVAAGLVLFAIAPDRLRLFTRVVVVAAAAAFAGPAIFDVFSAGEAGERVIPVLHEAGRKIGLSVVVAAAVGLLLALADSRWHPSVHVATGVRRAGAGGLALAVVAAIVLAVANGGRIADKASEQYESFKGGEPTSGQSEGNRLGTLAYNRERSDYYRVAFDLFEEAPVAGVGAGNFERRYTAERREPKHSRYAHSIWLRALSDTGVIGLALLLLAIAAAVVGPLAALRRLDRGTRWTVATCIAATAYFVLHASFDWIEEIPAIASPAFGMMALGLALAASGGVEARERRRARLKGRAARVVPIAVAVVAGVAVSFAVLMPYMSVRYNDRALQRYRVDRTGALQDAERAQSFNPLWQIPYLTEGTIAVNTYDDQRARRAFAEALEREDAWYPHFELAMLNAEARDWAAARREIRRAGALSGEDPAVAEVAERIRRRRSIDAAAFNARIGRRTRADFTTRQK